MNRRAAALAALVGALTVGACEYVVVPPDDGALASVSKGWTAVATQVGPAAGADLRIDLTIRNETGDWSAMEAAGAVVTAGDGAESGCTSVFVGTGGHRIGPGMQLRGYVAGPKATPTTELVRVECPGATVAPGSRLVLDYHYVSGEYDYYHPDTGRVRASLEVDLDQIAQDLQYPIAEPVEGLVQPADTEITALNDVLLTLSGADRSANGLVLDWTTSNPGEYPTFVHIGIPPVIGADGILYGFYESPDLESVPATPPGETAAWTTEVDVPGDVGGFYILLSVESKKQRLFVNYAIELGDI
jgi:hypothetical protein